MTVTVAHASVDKESGKEAVIHLILAADYHLMRDGITAAGVITGVDAKFDGQWSEDDIQDEMDGVADLQKVLGEGLFGMALRLNGETLVVGNVRLPGTDSDKQPFGGIGGHYKAAGNKVLKPKAKAISKHAPDDWARSGRKPWRICAATT